MRSLRRTLVFLLFAWSTLLRAQEMRYIDLSLIRQHTELRHPPAPPADCKAAGGCMGSGHGGGSIEDCGPDLRDPHALGVYLLHVTPPAINSVEPFKAEFKVLNTGVEVPVSPHLSDLQPRDQSVTFSYLSLALVMGAESQPHGSNVPTVGLVELYGATEHNGSVLMLKPGEWIRVRANIKLPKRPRELGSALFRGDFWLRRNTFHPNPGREFIETLNLCPHVTRTPSIAVHLLSGNSEQPKP